VPLDDLMRQSDFVSIHCPLNESTRHLIDGRRIALMKPDAIIVNTARGGVIDQAALTDALLARRIGGAGLDVFAEEPPRADDPLLRLDNVVLSAHALNWTRNLDADLGRANARAAQALMSGRLPEGVVNGAVAGDPRFRAKLAALMRAAERHDTLQPTLTIA
jgi:phosphoglycerate dehydrogenase-like enzyme